MDIEYKFDSETISGIMGFETLEDMHTALKEEIEAKDHPIDYKTLAIGTIISSFGSPKFESLVTGIMLAAHSLIDEDIMDPGSLAKYLLKLDEDTLRSLSTSIIQFTMLDSLETDDLSELKKTIDKLKELVQ